MFMYNEQEYQKSYHKKWYKQNKEERKAKIRQRRDEIAKWFEEYKSKLKCETCPENHPATLDFHHIDPKQKDLKVSRALINGWSKERILKEIAKCKVLCANCHRKLHY